METRERVPLYYQTKSRTFPFGEWRASISDENTKAAVDARIARLRGGNFGDSRPIGGGASENRIDFGPGYRIYYGISGDNIILLCAGDKSTQAADVKRAKDYWKDYKKRNKAQLELETRAKKHKPTEDKQ
jgi:putative addiction module killer protein